MATSSIAWVPYRRAAVTKSADSSASSGGTGSAVATMATAPPLLCLLMALPVLRHRSSRTVLHNSSHVSAFCYIRLGILGSMSGDGTRSGAGAPLFADGDIAVRRMRDDQADYERMVAWRNAPHVRRWWDPDEPPLTLQGAIAEYRPDTLDTSPTTACVIEYRGEPVGFVQFFPWSAYPEYLDETGITVPDGAWSLDILVGVGALVGRGIGSRVVDLLCRHLFTARGARAVAFGVAADNERARRAYARAGMHEAGTFLDTDVKEGARVPSLLLLRERDV